MFGSIFGNTKKRVLEFLRKEAYIIDVRTPQEFEQGNVMGSKNIPLNKIAEHVERLKAEGKPVITCCASGMRSGKAEKILKKAGIEVVNGGAWQKVEKIMENL